MICILTIWFPSSNWIPTLLFTAGPVTVPFFSFNSCVCSPCRLILLPTYKVEVCWSNILLAFFVSLMLTKPCGGGVGMSERFESLESRCTPGAGAPPCALCVTVPATRQLPLRVHCNTQPPQAISTVMGIQQPCKQVKGTRPTRVEWGDDQLNFLFDFFLKKMTRDQVKYI